MNDFIISKKPDDELLLSTGDAILLPEGRSGHWRPPLARIGGELRRLVPVVDSGLPDNINRISAPTNIQREYVGYAGSEITIVPDGAFHVNGLSVDYVFVDSEMNVIELTNAPLTFPTTVGDVAQYGVYATANGSGPMVEFSLRSIPEVLPEEEFSVSDLAYTIPSEVYSGLSGTGEIRFDVNVSPEADVKVVIFDSRNITLSETNLISAGDQVDYIVDSKSASNVVLDYYYVTPSGKRTADKQLVITNRRSELLGSPFEEIDSFPSEVTTGDTFTWRFGNVAPGVVRILSLTGLTTNHVGPVLPGEPVTLQVIGVIGQSMSLTYALRNGNSVLTTTTLTALIGDARFDLSDFSYTLNPDTSELTTVSPDNIIDVTLHGLEDASHVELTSSSLDAVVHPSPLGIPNQYRVLVGREYDPAIPLVLPLVVTGVDANNITRRALTEVVLTVNRTEGEEYIKFSRIFTKPQGATNLTIVTHGGANYENTILTGLINRVYNGGLTQPAPSSLTFTGLDPDEDTITFDLATNSTAFVAWS